MKKTSFALNILNPSILGYIYNINIYLLWQKKWHLLLYPALSWNWQLDPAVETLYMDVSIYGTQQGKGTETLTQCPKEQERAWRMGFTCYFQPFSCPISPVSGNTVLCA